MKLALVTPWSSPFIWSKFAKNAVDLLTNFKRTTLGWETAFFMGYGVDPAGRHVNMVLQALDWGADLICIVGADQIHPVDMLDRLVDRYYETNGPMTGSVITALVPFRGYVSWQKMRPFQPMGWRFKTGDQVTEVKSLGETPDLWEEIDPADGDLQKVDVIGSGVMLFDRETIEALKKPWWYYQVDPETMQRVADMDTKMCWRLRSEVGVQVWVDTTIKVRHLHTFEIDDTFSGRFADWMEEGVTEDETVRFPQVAGDAAGGLTE